jgi:hypothetical protein
MVELFGEELFEEELSGEDLLGKEFPMDQSVMLYPLSLSWSIDVHTNLVHRKNYVSNSFSNT